MVGSGSICLLVAAALMGAWYLCFRRVNRRRATCIMEWVECSLGGHGHVLGLRWVSPSRLRIPLRLPGRGFQRASMYVELLPRELPFSWLFAALKHRHDQVTFEADLETPPRFNLQVHSHRWCGRTRKKINPLSESWTFEESTPIVITTRSEWQREITMMMNSLLTSRDHELLGLCFRRRSPHFSASLRLESLVPRGGRATIFDTLRELATDASAARF